MKSNLPDMILISAADLPIECQELLLTLAQGMAFTRRCLLKQSYRENSNALSIPKVNKIKNYKENDSNEKE